MNEVQLEQTAIAWFKELGYSYEDGALIAPGELAAERDEFDEVVLQGRLLESLQIVCPSKPIINEFEKLVDNLINESKCNLYAIKSLKDPRDLVLTRLFSENYDSLSSFRT